MKKKLIILVTLLWGILTAATAQIDGLGIRTNLLAWAIGSPGLGADISWNSRYLLAIDGNYGDWDIDPDDSRIRHTSYGIELRRYLSKADAYRGIYFGVDARFNLFNFTIGKPHKEGEATTVGLLAGYTFRMGKAWAVDAAIGAGYIHRDYNEFTYYPPVDMNRKTRVVTGNKFGLTHLRVALVYRFSLNN